MQLQPDVDRRPRISFDITEEQQDRANRLLAVYGMRRAVFSCLLDDLLDLIELHGDIIVGVLLSESTKPREVLPSLVKAKTVGESYGNS